MVWLYLIEGAGSKQRIEWGSRRLVYKCPRKKQIKKRYVRMRGKVNLESINFVNFVPTCNARIKVLLQFPDCYFSQFSFSENKNRFYIRQKIINKFYYIHEERGVNFLTRPSDLLSNRGNSSFLFDSFFPPWIVEYLIKGLVFCK